MRFILHFYVFQLKEARANERNLRARCRNLTNELALLKRQGLVKTQKYIFNEILDIVKSF